MKRGQIAATRKALGDPNAAGRCEDALKAVLGASFGFTSRVRAFRPDPDAIRGAIRQHQSANPATLFLVRRVASGDYVAVLDIPFAGEMSRRFLAGQVVLSRSGVAHFALRRALRDWTHLSGQRPVGRRGPQGRVRLTSGDQFADADGSPGPTT